MLDIVIVNWNSGDRLRSVISTISEHHAGIVRSVVIVDNDSTDESVDMVTTMTAVLPFDLQVMRNRSNRGFAAACNQGAARGTGEYILFLNPDTRIFENSLARPLEFLRDQKSHHVGIVGIQLVDEHGNVARSCSRFPSLARFAAQATGISRVPMFRVFSQAMNEWDHRSTRQVDQVMGAFFLVSRSLFELLGGFDERFFVYFEEVDFARRALDRGWSSVYLADARAFHEGGGTSRQVRPQRLFYSMRSRLLYGFKHFGFLEAWLLVLVTLVLEPLARTVFCMVAGEGVRHTWRGYAMLYGDMPAVLRRARRP